MGRGLHAVSEICEDSPASLAAPLVSRCAPALGAPDAGRARPAQRPGLSAKHASWALLCRVLLVIHAGNVHCRGGRSRMDIGPRRGDGAGEKPAVGSTAQCPSRRSPAGLGHHSRHTGRVRVPIMPRVRGWCSEVSLRRAYGIQRPLVPRSGLRQQLRLSVQGGDHALA
jgi:hypothetical protein